MDKFIAAAPVSEVDGDLTLCLTQGVAYQTDMIVTASYDGSYFDKCASYSGSEIEDKLNYGRRSMVDRWVSHYEAVLDIGIGSGAFIRARPNTWGTDINPRAVEWLHDQNKWAGNSFFLFRAFTMWDVIEHVPNPEDYIKQMKPRSYLFVSIPTFKNLDQIRRSRHYRPGEHLYYFTEWGLPLWLEKYGFKLLDMSDFETKAGRDGITSYVFRRDYLEARTPL